jgi:hypothetical protein
MWPSMLALCIGHKDEVDVVYTDQLADLLSSFRPPQDCAKRLDSRDVQVRRAELRPTKMVSSYEHSQTRLQPLASCGAKGSQASFRRDDSCAGTSHGIWRASATPGHHLSVIAYCITHSQRWLQATAHALRNNKAKRSPIGSPPITQRRATLLVKRSVNAFHAHPRAPETSHPRPHLPLTITPSSTPNICTTKTSTEFSESHSRYRYIHL